MCNTSMYAIQVNKVGLKPTTYYTLIGSYKEKLVRTIPGDYSRFGLASSMQKRTKNLIVRKRCLMKKKH